MAKKWKAIDKAGWQLRALFIQPVRGHKFEPNPLSLVRLTVFCTRLPHNSAQNTGQHIEPYLSSGEHFKYAFLFSLYAYV